LKKKASEDVIALRRLWEERNSGSFVAT